MWLRRDDGRVDVARLTLGVTFVIAGTLHFVKPQSYEAVMPPYLPAHAELVLISGAAEIVGGILVLVPRTRLVARWWMLALLAAILPANVYMATDPEEIRGLPDIPGWLLWARLPLQAVFAAWVVRATRPR